MKVPPHGYINITKLHPHSDMNTWKQVGSKSQVTSSGFILYSSTAVCP